MAAWLHPVHPKLVHFPIALLLTALAFEFLSVAFKRKLFHDTALCLYGAVVLILPWVVRSGEIEAHRLNLHHPILEKHEFFAVATMWTVLLSVPVLYVLFQKRPRAARWIFLTLLVVLAGLVSAAGHYGGVMVYEYGVGVDF